MNKKSGKSRERKIVKINGCSGTSVRKLVPVNGLQCLEVRILPGGEVPLHSHGCAATMIVVAGSARKLQLSGKGRVVRPGDVVIKAAGEPHGFTEVGPDGFRFISLSEGEGIVTSRGLDLAFARS